MRYDGREGKGKSREIRMRGGGVTRIDRRISTRGKKLEWLLTSDEARTEWGGREKKGNKKWLFPSLEGVTINRFRARALCRNIKWS